MSNTDMPTMPKTQRRFFPKVDPKYRLLPPVDPETYAGLRANIALNGIVQPIVCDENGFLLDGHARAQISIELDYELPYLIHKGACEEEKRALIRALNLARRQLTPVANREIIAAQIRETPKLSNRRIAKALGVSHSTVMSVRNELARTGRVVQSDHLVGLDGRERPAHSTIRPSAPSLVARPGNFGFASTKPNDIETPAGVAQFLHDLISPKYAVKTILDPCAGSGVLTRTWKGRKILSCEIKNGKDFFRCPERIDCDLVLCNPPFNSGDGSSRLLLPQEFLRRILEVVPPRTPIVLFAPMGLRLNCSQDSKRYAWLRDECPPITSIISLPLDIFPNVLFHSEILLFNMGKLKAHYCLDEKYF